MKTLWEVLTGLLILAGIAAILNADPTLGLGIFLPSALFCGAISSNI